MVKQLAPAIGRGAARRVRFVPPSPGDNPYAFLEDRLLRHDPVAVKTVKILAAIWAYFRIEAPGGGPVPAKRISARTGIHHTDCRQIAAVWAGIIFNREIRRVDWNGDSLAPPAPLMETLDSIALIADFNRPLSAPCPPKNGGTTNQSRPPEVPPGRNLSGGGGADKQEELARLIKDKNKSVEEALLELFRGSSHWAGTQRPAASDLSPSSPHAAAAALSALVCRETTTAFERRQLARAHLKGSARLTVYPMPTGGRFVGRTRIGAVDLDGDGDRLQDALKLMDALKAHGQSGYISRSWTWGCFHIWVFFCSWLPAQKVARFLERLCTTAGVGSAEIRPSGGGLLARTGGPGQLGIAIPFFGDGGHSGDRCQIIDPASLRPIPLPDFLSHVDLNPAPPEVPDPTPSTRLGRCLAWAEAEDHRTAEAMADAWPGTSEGEVQEAPNGLDKAGRNALALSLAGALARRFGIIGNDALPLLRTFNEIKLIPPLPDKEVQKICKQAATYAARRP